MKSMQSLLTIKHHRRNYFNMNKNNELPNDATIELAIIGAVMQSTMEHSFWNDKEKRAY